MEPAVAKDMLRGAPDPLWSEFRLGYAGLLAQLRSEDADPEQLLGSSFRQFQLQRALPALRTAIAAKVPFGPCIGARRTAESMLPAAGPQLCKACMCRRACAETHSRPHAGVKPAAPRQSTRHMLRYKDLHPCMPHEAERDAEDAPPAEGDNLSKIQGPYPSSQV